MPDVLCRRHFFLILGSLVSYLASCENSADNRRNDGRTVTHSLGTLALPKEPQRIVALTGTIELDCLLALGIQPIAAAGQDYGGSLFFPPHYVNLLEGTKLLPSRGNISLEAILKLKPDLLIGTQGWLEAIYPQLSEIAPTYVFEPSDTIPWQDYLYETFNLFVDYLDLKKVENIIQGYQQRLDILNNQYQFSLKGITYSSIYYESLLQDSQIYIYNHIDMKNILEGIGFTPLSTRSEDNYYTRLSLERFDLIDSDVIFLYSYGVQEAVNTQVLHRIPILSRLKAVQADRVFLVPSPYWYLTGPLAIQWVLNDLENVILPFFLSSNQ